MMKRMQISDKKKQIPRSARDDSVEQMQRPKGREILPAKKAGGLRMTAKNTMPAGRPTLRARLREGMNRGIKVKNRTLENSQGCGTRRGLGEDDSEKQMTRPKAKQKELACGGGSGRSLAPRARRMRRRTITKVEFD
jgi:hypothetical protein